MQRRHYYEQPYPSESIPLESPYDNRGPSPGYHPDQHHAHAQPHAYSGHSQEHYEVDDSANPFSNHHHYNPELSSASSAGSRNYPDHQYHGHGDGYSHGHSHITPGADNFGHAASGGVAGIAYSVADERARGSGADAMHHVDRPPLSAYGNSYHSQPHAQSGPYDANMPPAGGIQNPFAGGSDSTRSSLTNNGLGPASNPFPMADPHPRSANSQLGVVDPNAIADDGDDGLHYGRRGRTSMLSLHSNPSGRNGLGAGAAAGGVMGPGSNQNSGAFNDGTAAGAAAGGGGGRTAAILEKESPWIKKQSSGKKKWRWAIIIGVVLIILGAVVGGVLGSVLGNDKQEDDHKTGKSADDDLAENGDLSLKSDEIQKLLNNKNLHKVFPGMDYTPNNSQYPDCEKNPPSQNNITRDVAVLSQLTDTVRLYGTDCNQTQMVLHSIERLELKDTMKVWLGVWQDGNSTTNERQLDQMWDILNEYGDEPFAGLIIANEILFREEMTISELSKILGDTRKELAKKNIDLPVATSDLGDDLTQALVDESDYVMANIHPFFAGVSAEDAASWTWSFWEGTNGKLWKKEKSKNIIAEVGWPTAGGSNKASKASVSGANQLLDDWVCDALTNGTNYFWFSAFDEPWKESFNEKGKEWEDKWGLFDVDRNLKDGITIPDCGGDTI